MNRETLQRISVQRRREASALLQAGLYPGAYYLIGYAVECALKACIARRTARYDFPDRKVAQDSWTHDLAKLVQVAELGSDLTRDTARNASLELNWDIVKGWSEAYRYDLRIARAEARQIYYACTSRQNGILSWIRKRW